MIHLYAQDGPGLAELPRDAAATDAVWIDLYRPTTDQVTRVEALGVQVPTLADMEEIEISNRLYRDNGADYMIAVLSGQTPDKEQVSSPVAFILTGRHLITVRHHAPRPFETFGTRADKSSTGCATPAHLFLGLVEEILGRQADLLEGIGRGLDATSRQVFGTAAGQRAAALEQALTSIAGQGELLSRVRLGLLTMERALAYFSLSLDERGEARGLRTQAKARVRDLQALEVHADFLASRLAFATDATLGMVNLAQNMTVRIVSVVAVLFLPPTLIASIYGMNFRAMPELAEPWGYPVALALMVGSALATWLFFRWKNWL
jgi:magnesium transporter